MPYVPLDCRIAPEPTAPAAARRSAAAWLRDRGVSERVVDDALIVVSELVANGVLHGSALEDIALHVDIEADDITIAVTTGPAAPATSSAPRGEPYETGRGLAMVAACCGDVEVVRDPSGHRRTVCRIAMVPAGTRWPYRHSHAHGEGTGRPPVRAE